MSGKGQIKPRWKKGESGNPKGRPKGKSISTHLKELLEGKVKNASTGELKTRAEVLALKLFEKAMSGNVADTTTLKAIEQILDRTEGKAMQNVDVKSNGESIRPINVEVVDEATAKAVKKLMSEND